MWNLIGAGAALALAALAWHRSRTTGGFYDEGVYGMTRRTHARYAAGYLVLALVLAAAGALHADTAGFAGLAILVLGAILYLSSFLRGASDYHE